MTSAGKRARIVGVLWLAMVAGVVLWRWPVTDIAVEHYVHAFAERPSAARTIVVHPPWRSDVVAVLQALAPQQRIVRTLNPVAGSAWPDVVVLADAAVAVPAVWQRVMVKTAHDHGIDRWELRR
jgi:hypothetical protein